MAPVSSSCLSLHHAYEGAILPKTGPKTAILGSIYNSQSGRGKLKKSKLQFALNWWGDDPKCKRTSLINMGIPHKLVQVPDPKSAENLKCERGVR